VGFTGSHCETAISKSESAIRSTTEGRSMEVVNTLSTVSIQTTITVSSTDVLPSTSSGLVTTISSKQIKESSSRKPVLRPSSSFSNVVSTYSTYVPPILTQQPKIVHIFKIKILEDWNDDLKDKNSAAYKDLSSRLEIEIWNKLSGRKDLIGVRVTSFSKGSIVAEFQLMFRKVAAAEGTVANLRREISDGKLGSLSVDPASLEQIPDGTQEPTKETQGKKMSYAIIIAVSFGGLFVFALASICLIRFCKRNKMGRRQRRGSEMMPSEEAFPNREKYEMQNAQSEENIIYFEEVGVWAKGTEGKSNEAFN